MVHFLIALLKCLDIGTYGEVFPIQEDDLLVFLQKWMKTNHEKEATILYPKAKAPRSFEFDPSISLTQDVKNHHGDPIIFKGAKVNPLDITPLSENLLFFEGNDPFQLAWAKQEKGLWIHLNEQPFAQTEHNPPLAYFDHSGYLASKLGIVSIPAKVSQKNKKLLIEEVPCLSE